MKLEVPGWKIENIINDIDTAIKEDTAYLQAWEKVTRNRKKGGSDFANLKKNFNGLTVDSDYVKELIVYTSVGAHYISDRVYIDNCETVDEMFTAIEKHKSDLEQRIANNLKDSEHARGLILKCLDIFDKALAEFTDSVDGDTLKKGCLKLLSNEIRYYG